MPRTLPANSLAGILAQETGQAWIILLTITHDGASSPETWTSDAVDTVFNGTTYEQFPFDVILPSSEIGKIPESTLTITNVSRDIIGQLRSQSTPMSVQIDIVASDDIGDGISTGVLSASFQNFTLRSIEYTNLVINGRLTLDDFLGEPYGGVFSQDKYPGLFVQGGTFDGDYTYEPPVSSSAYTDFSGYTTGAQPSDWTIAVDQGFTTFTVEEDAGAVGGKRLLAQSDDSARHMMLTWDAVGVAANVEILVKGYFDDLGSRNDINGVCIRQTGTFYGTVSNDLEAYIACVGTDGKGRVYHVEWNHIEARVELTTTPVTLSITDGDPYWVRFRIEGDDTPTISVQWSTTDLNGVSPSWDFTITPDGSASEPIITGAGAVGISNRSDSVGGFNEEYYYDQFAAATDGDTAAFA